MLHPVVKDHSQRKVLVDQDFYVCNNNAKQEHLQKGEANQEQQLSDYGYIAT